MADDYLYMPQPEQPEPSALQKLWNARPWQGYAENPPSMAPQLGIAMGLLHPSLGRATRDMGMAREMARRPVDVPAQVPGDASMHARIGMAERDIGNMRRFVGHGGDDIRFGAANVNSRANMRPNLIAAPSQQPQAAAQSPYKPGSRVAQYEAHLANLERQGVPYEQFPTWQAFFRGMD